ncbi:hypothetical protein HJA91_28635 [Rhizobium binae]|nr:hypothetical protein [Rhizobium binae]MBX4963475.1 hypothetical protein [Rhizobium binae]MBX4995395.1 hypothetical protein [Rhizobium binae]
MRLHPSLSAMTVQSRDLIPPLFARDPFDCINCGFDQTLRHRLIGHDARDGYGTRTASSMMMAPPAASAAIISS